MESFYFTVFGLVFCILLMIIYFPKKKVSYLENKMYSILIIVTFFNCLVEVYSFILVQGGCDPYSLQYLLTLKVLFSGFLSWVYFFTLYILMVTISNTKIEDKARLIVKKSLILYFVILLIILVLPIEVTNINGILLPSGPSVNVLYLCAGICILLMIIVFFKNIKNFRSKKYVPLYLLIFLFGIVVIIQNVFPTLFLVNAALVLITFVMYFTIENPDVKMINELNKNRLLVNQITEEKSNFLFLASSQLKSPISDILKISDNVTSEKDENIIKEDVKQINNLAHSLMFLVENVMDISTLTINNIKIVNNKYNLSNLITKIKLLKEKEVNKEVEFRVNISETIPSVLYGDSKLLELVVNSIIDNSIKYTKTGFIELNVNTIVKYDMCRLLISIEDSGCGISIDKVNELLMLDEELNKEEIASLETKNVNINTIKKIISKMGGYFTIKSEIDKGTEVKIVIDQKIGIKDNLLDVEKYLKKETILVVSSDNNFLKSISKLINKKGYNVETSIYSNDILDRIRLKQTFSYILIDDNIKNRALPILKELKKDAKFKTPVIVILDKNTEFIKKHFLEDGFSDYLLKSDLVKEIDRVLKGAVVKRTN